MRDRTKFCLRLLSALFVFQLPETVPMPPDVTFALATADGRTMFEIGEPIRIELRFRADTLGKYVFHAGNCFRPQPDVPDRLRAEPSADVVDLKQFDPDYSTGVRAIPPPPVALESQVLKSECFLNDWVVLRKPGRYRVVAESYRIAPVDTQRGMLLKSTALEIDITPSQPAAESARLQGAAGVIDRLLAGAVVNENDRLRAIDTVRFSQRREALPLMLRLLRLGRTPVALNAFLSSPYQAEILADMEKDFESPDFGVTSDWIFMLSRFAGWLQTPPFMGDPSQIRERYFGRLVTLLGTKRDAARLTSLGTIIERGIVYGRLPSTDPLRNSIYQSFRDLHPAVQKEVLKDRWAFIATPEIEPLLRSWATDSGARDLALLRLGTINPAEARRVALDRIRRGDIVWNLSTGRLEQGWDAILQLPEQTLPEMDAALAQAYEIGKPVEALLARYATNSVYRRIRTAFELRQPGPFKVCSVLHGIHPIVLYFYRVDPEYADRLVSDARREVQWKCPLFSPIVPSPGLVRAAIRDLSGEDPALHEAATNILRDSGLAEARNALWDALERIRRLPREYGAPDPQSAVAVALTAASGWVLRPREFERLLTTCTSKECTSAATLARDRLREPIVIESVFSELDVRVGPFRVAIPDLERKLRQFPPNTAFIVSAGIPQGTTSWSGSLLEERIRKAVEAAGMRIVTSPSGLR